MMHDVMPKKVHVFAARSVVLMYHLSSENANASL